MCSLLVTVIACKNNTEINLQQPANAPKMVKNYTWYTE
jgi:hypothetical protein